MPTPTRVVHCKHENYDVYVGRPSIFGNPFRIGPDGTRLQVIAKYARWIQNRPDLLARLPALRGKALGCHCAPLPCHASVLACLADGRAIDLDTM